MSKVNIMLKIMQGLLYYRITFKFYISKINKTLLLKINNLYIFIHTHVYKLFKTISTINKYNLLSIT